MRADSMGWILWAIGASVLIQGCMCSALQTSSGCMKWTEGPGDDVCCEACNPGHRLITECGPKLKGLCTPCEAGKYILKPTDRKCQRCSQCVGAQVMVKECTATTDTQCGCKEGLTCGDAKCSFCVKKCDKGQEPTEKRSCRPCPEGTFNDQIHQRCKPWSTECQHIVTKGDALTDITCGNVSVDSSKKPGPAEQEWPLSVVATVVLSVFSIIIILFITILAKKNSNKKKEDVKKPITSTPIITTPTDDPRTLIAVECSFHEAQQEQGSRSELLGSSGSSDQFIA
ncbi:tumor necrosis factor receptor superfamily member 9a [Pseudochaenichthys georgianus]|nr:tumor necrosis factor receptor superfamily member 9a [Pseudochaenichthys georgianus]